jgi:hypothetical protein
MPPIGEPRRLGSAMIDPASREVSTRLLRRWREKTCSELLPGIVLQGFVDSAAHCMPIVPALSLRYRLVEGRS